MTTDRERTRWDAAAAGWERWDAWFDETTRPLTEWMCDAAGISPGMEVLDLACGSGQPAITAARRVAPGGRVLATDLSPEMVAVTSRKIGQLGLDNITVKVMSLDAIEAPDLAFDAVTCRFGLMFSADPTHAAREIRRVLKPAGRATIVVWGAPAANPFFTVRNEVVSAFTGTPPADPSAPGVFALAGDGALDRVLRAAGFDDVAVAQRALQVPFDSRNHYWEVQSEMAEGLRAALAKLSHDEARRLRDAVLAAVEPYVDPRGRVVFDGVALCARVVR